MWVLHGVRDTNPSLPIVMDEDLITRLLPFLQSDLRNPDRIVLCALALGYDPRHLRDLPTLRNSTRTRAVLNELTARGRLDAEGRPVPYPPPSPEDLACVLGRKKMQEALGCFEQWEGLLSQLGLGALVDALPAADVGALEETFLDLSRFDQDDKLVRAAVRQGWYLHAARTRPSSASPDQRPPADLLAETQRILGHRPQHRRDQQFFAAIQDLNRHVAARLLDGRWHWWLLLQHVERTTRTRDQSRKEFTGRILGLLLRRRCPPLRQLIRSLGWDIQDAADHMRRYPVPRCGYGPWVVRERALKRRLCREVCQGFGRRIQKTVWHHAHRCVQGEFEAIDDPARLRFVDPDLYEAKVMEVARLTVRKAQDGAPLSMLLHRSFAGTKGEAGFLLRECLRRVRKLATDSARLADPEVGDWGREVLARTLDSVRGRALSAKTAEGLWETRPNLRPDRSRVRRSLSEHDRFRSLLLHELERCMPHVTMSGSSVSPVPQIITAALRCSRKVRLTEEELADALRSLLRTVPVVHVIVEGVPTPHYLEDVGSDLGILEPIQKVVDGVLQACAGTLDRRVA